DGEDGDAIQNSRGNSDGEDSGKNFNGDGQNIGYGEGACEDGNSSEETDYNNEYEAQIDANIERKLDSLLEEMKEQGAIKTLEGERIRELDEFANNIAYGNAHKNIKVRVNRASEITERMEEAYKEISPPLLAIAKNMAKKYLQIADAARQGGRLDGLLMGRKFNAAAAYRTDGKVFMKMIMPQQMSPIVVGILLDESGSMSGKRSEVAMATAIIIQNFCEQLGIPVAIYGHSTGSYECELYSYMEFDTYNKNDKFRLTDIGARGCNRDGAALRFLAERLMTRPEEAKLLMLVSDGQPNGDGGYWGAKAEADLRGIQKEYTKKGVCFCAAAIGDDKQVIKNIYGDAFLDISDLNQLPNKLVKVIEKYLKVV
ncbi:MAG: nitric oxide reductase activation protein NorD, partial [Acutalibacteraceae bacterium]|nr:nitric oxide reductase activation protein NorD [Acutalibacteraceae bacterium]